MIVSVTERQTYKRCRQQWQWASFNNEAYQPVINKPALAIGRLWHATQAEWSLHPEEDPNELAKTLAVVELERVKETYYEKVGAPISPSELDPIYEQMSMVLAMVHNYHMRWGTPLPDGFHMVAPEQTCLIPIPGTEHECPTCETWGSTAPEHQCDDRHYLEGTLDGLIADEYGQVYILERKTYGQRPRIEVLNMQDQFLAYLWILRALNIGAVGGLAYDGAWKRKEPPRGSTLEDLFLRLRLNRSSRELDNFGIQLAAEVNEMASDPAIYLNRDWQGCWDCDFQQPCVAKLRGEDYQGILNTRYTQRPHTEDSVRELRFADT